MTTRSSAKIPKKQLQQVYDMACEMSYSTSYGVETQEGEFAGRDPKIVETLNIVRKFFKLKGGIEQ